METTGKAVLVCSNNAVWFGLTSDPMADPIELTKARQAYHWVNPGGHCGLANSGPAAGSRVGAAGSVILRGVVCVIDASASRDAWLDYPVTTK